MNNEPVAWMLADKEAEHIRSIMAVQHDFVPDGCVEIPLYTHPAKTPMLVLDGNRVYPTAKTLTAEEINQVAKKCKWDYDEMNVVDFGRAILRKAQEK